MTGSRPINPTPPSCPEHMSGFCFAFSATKILLDARATATQQAELRQLCGDDERSIHQSTLPTNFPCSRGPYSQTRYSFLGIGATMRGVNMSKSVFRSRTCSWSRLVAATWAPRKNLGCFQLDLKGPVLILHLRLPSSFVLCHVLIRLVLSVLSPRVITKSAAEMPLFLEPSTEATALPLAQGFFFFQLSTGLLPSFLTTGSLSFCSLLPCSLHRVSQLTKLLVC
jgi:hypothetical protein